MKSKKLAKALAAAGLGLMLMSGSVNAGVTFFPPVTAFEDDNLDFWFDNDNNGLISVGDRLVAVLEFNTSFGTTTGGPASFLPHELTGVSDVTVVAKIPTATAGKFDFVMGPTLNGVLGNAIDFNGALVEGAGLGAMVALWLDATPDLTINPTNCTSYANCLTRAMDGNLFMSAGYDLDPNVGWVALNAEDNPALVAAAPAATKVGTVNFFLNVLANPNGYAVLPQDCAGFCPPGADNAVEIIGSADLLGGRNLPANLTAPANPADPKLFARSDTDFTMAVPEPGSLALMAVAMLGLGGSMRRRQA